MALQHNIIMFLLLVSLSPKIINCNSQYNDLQHDIMDAIDIHGYNEMTRSLNFALEVFYPATTNVHIAGLTIFAPTNEGLLSLESPISREEHLISIKPPPMDSTLLQYHMVPLKLDANNLTLFSSTLPTLLYGHNLTVTTSPHDPYNNNPSLNNVLIKEWNIYNDGRIVVHGVERFLDPNFHLIVNKNTTTTAAAETSYNKEEAASPGPSEDDYEDEAGYKILANYIIFFALLCLSVFIIDKFCSSAYDD